MHKSKVMPDDDSEEEYEYGALTPHAIDADRTDFSHQFIAPLFIGFDGK